jgi:flagellar basal-body rod protein FlgB
MIDRLFTNDTMAILQKSLDASALQQKLSANNLANVDTPGFKRSEVLFTERLKAAIASQQTTQENLQASVTNAKHMAFNTPETLDHVAPQVITRNDTTLRNDGNNVDVDQEMAKLAENTVFYSALAQVTTMRLGMLKTSITEGRK